jgi:MSHA pilin protein MshA
MIKMNPISHAQKGFTLIELIMVIVILGILSAFALPKFADLSGSATVASANAGLGAVKSAAAIAHAQSLANGGGTPISLEGTDITMANGYPSANTAATEGDICTAAGIDSDYGCVTTGAGTVADPYIMTITLDNCSFTYEEAASDGSPTISAMTCT